jgi:hypothetical protein
MKPKEKERPISEKTYEELAISIAVKAYANGIWLRNFDSAIGGAAVGGNAQFFVEQNNILRLEIDKLANSESYRIGLMITAIPRAVKRFFKKIFRRR